MHYRLFSLSLAAGLSLSACRTGEPPRGGDILTPEARGEIPGGWSAAHSPGMVAPGWIRAFRDPSLTDLVEEALIRNPDLKAAAARVEASQASVRIAAATLYPRAAIKVMGERQGQELSGSVGGIDPPDLGAMGVDVSGGSADSRGIDSSSERWIYGLGVGSSWEADVWARVRSKKAAAVADSLSLQADLEYARQALAAQVARAYISAIEAARQAANAEETLKLYEEYSRLTGILKDQGFASDFELSQIGSRSAAAKDTLIAAKSARAQAVRALEVVTSHYPAGRAEVRRNFPDGPGKVPAGVPSELLERRPDLIAAECRFAAAFHRVNEARAARLPRFAISVTGALGSANVDGVGVLDAVNWSLASGVVQPIFFGGELKAAQDLRTAEQKAAAAQYTAAALRAFKEVEDAMSNESFLRQREEVLREMVASSGQSVTLGGKQFEQGHTEMFTLLRLAGENLGAKVELTKIQASRLRERVDLYLALGGGFSVAQGK